MAPHAAGPEKPPSAEFAGEGSLIDVRPGVTSQLPRGRELPSADAADVTRLRGAGVRPRVASKPASARVAAPARTRGALVRFQLGQTHELPTARAADVARMFRRVVAFGKLSPANVAGKSLPGFRPITVHSLISVVVTG